MKKNLTHISSILDTALKDLRPAKDTEMTLIWALWNRAMGETVARETRPAAFMGNTLIVNVSCSAWLQHLNFSKHEMIRNINCALERDMVKEIRFKIAAIHN
ncbi:MAG: DUF721 domain-containing protein [Desulfamplus sp.]|nr:DUF721 domain-containing protein [Desulfamplus sp.]